MGQDIDLVYGLLLFLAGEKDLSVGVFYGNRNWIVLSGGPYHLDADSQHDSLLGRAARWEIAPEKDTLVLMANYSGK